MSARTRRIWGAADAIYTTAGYLDIDYWWTQTSF